MKVELNVFSKGRHELTFDVVCGGQSVAYLFSVPWPSVMSAMFDIDAGSYSANLNSSEANEATQRLLFSVCGAWKPLSGGQPGGLRKTWQGGGILTGRKRTSCFNVYFFSFVPTGATKAYTHPRGHK